MNEKIYWVYILYCNNKCFYTGYTVNLEKRFQAHCQGTASKYTRSFKPLYIAQSWRILGSKSLVMRMERQIKKLTREQKVKLIARPDLLISLLKE
jgi:putative endonuclease